MTKFKGQKARIKFMKKQKNVDAIREARKHKDFWAYELMATYDITCDCWYYWAENRDNKKDNMKQTRKYWEEMVKVRQEIIDLLIKSKI